MKKGFLSILLMSLFLTACDGGSNKYQAVGQAANDGGSAFETGVSQSREKLQDKERKIAEKHSIDIKIANDELAARHEMDMKKCRELMCEIMTSSISKYSASINMRIPPDKAPEFFTFISRTGAKISSHGISAEDKTLEYIDIDSRIKNKEALKEKLLVLLNNTKSNDIKALLEIEKELSRAQEEIDAAKTKMIYLSKLTDFTTVDIYYRVDSRDVDISYSSLKTSFKESWNRFIKSVAGVIVFIGAALPWIPIVFVCLWLLFKMVKVIRRRNRG